LLSTSACPFKTAVAPSPLPQSRPVQSGAAGAEMTPRYWLLASVLSLENLNHLSLHARKYDELKDLWQARVNRFRRFYFSIVGDTIIIRDIISHP
jgi:hypothetical protein